MSNTTQYRFFIRTSNGAEIEWRRLTRTQAERMYAMTSKAQPDNVVGFGWEVEE